jgi:2-dehydropantoate 2-reductase
MIDGPAVILGGGAVGSYVGGQLAAAGVQVVLIDGWPQHVEAIRARGLMIASPEGESLARPEAWHLAEAHRLRGLEPSAAFLATKLYDTEWSASLLARWLPADVPVATMQNGLVEESVARIVGWGRTLGVIAGGLDVALTGPGAVRRSRRRRASTRPTFKVGEMHGRSTPRAQRLADLLNLVDHAKVTTDLWGERWLKLCANSMTTGLSGLTGLSLREVYTREDTRRIAVKLAAEALAVGRVLGFDPAQLFGAASEVWHSAAAGDAVSLAQVMDALMKQAEAMTADGMSGTLQDLRKERPTEVEFFNGFVAAEAKRAGLKAPANAAVAAMIREAESKRRPISLDALPDILARADRVIE